MYFFMPQFFFCYIFVLLSKQAFTFDKISALYTSYYSILGMAMILPEIISGFRLLFFV